MNPNPNGYHAPSRAWLVWIAIFAGIMLLMLVRENWETRGDYISQHRFEELVDAGQIARATIYYDNQSQLNEIVGSYKIEGDANKQVPFRTKVRMTASLEERLFKMPQFEPRQPNTMFISIV